MERGEVYKHRNENFCIEVVEVLGSQVIYRKSDSEDHYQISLSRLSAEYEITD